MQEKHYGIPYREVGHGDFDAEWPPHDEVSGWWYITGYLTDQNNPKRLYSYQYTVIKPHLYGLTPYILQMAFTDFQTQKHIFDQRVSIRRGRKIYANQNNVVYSPYAHLSLEKDRVVLSTKANAFEFQFCLNKGKGAFWHADDGVLVMGLPDDPQQRTVYYSYTNMPTTGEVTLTTPSGKTTTLRVKGKSWLDRQWGSYRIIDPRSHWEWFSLRFFDEEEVMLFAFPQHPYYDGTYIDKEGNSRLIRNYEYRSKGFIKTGGYTFSKGWELLLPGVKEERYEIRPIMDGQLNLAYFELMAEIINPKKECVGYCFVELLPGVRNPIKKLQSLRNLLRNI